MKNKKILPIILLNIILILGITMSGIAWFKFKTYVTSNLILNTGNVDVIVEQNRWIVQHKDFSEISNKDATNNFQNVKPGDSFMKAIKLKNIGSLRQRITFEINEELPEKFKDIFKMIKRKPTEIILEPNQSKEIGVVRLNLLESTTKDNMQNYDVDFSSIDTKNFIKVKATQFNVPQNSILRLTGFSNALIADIKFKFLEGIIEVTSSGNEAHHVFGNREYIGFEIKDEKENTKIKLSINGNENANNFTKALNNFKFNTNDKIIIYANELNRTLISKDDGKNFIHFSRIGGHRAMKILKVTNQGLEERN